MRKFIDWLWMKFVATNKEKLVVFEERLRQAEIKTFALRR